MKRDVIGGIVGIALWIWWFVSSWRRAQRDREQEHQPRTFRDDAWMIVAAILVVIGFFVLIPDQASKAESAIVFVAVIATIYLLFHRAGERKRLHRRHGQHSEPPPSAER